ncbi:transporter substrate-binding domain-containing protein [Paraburkholderia oxyphila]|uniref:transporter substrate-binding domain-containing protein n=1 Tax=Paraburkholderia oxyphila TaxID=614212 RepID=UPI000483AB9D|nr:transporter substrate-binding domain-containing protein [Paraburkholderia oxyphila]
MQAEPQLPRDLAPHGVLRAAINLGNTVLAQRPDPGSDPTGVSVDLARALAVRLDVPVQFVVYDAAGKVFDGLANDDWDIAFLAIDSSRAEQITFSPPYLEIEGAFMARVDGPFQRCADVDRKGVKIAVGKGSAYDLFLSRSLVSAELERFPTSRESFSQFVAQELDVLAGVREVVKGFAASSPQLRVFPESFMTIRQAICLPKHRSTGERFVANFVEEMKAEGIVAASLERSGQTAATVAPPASEF